jgi:hypothetical protein
MNSKDRLRIRRDDYVRRVESLPDSYAFENLMWEKMVRRTTNSTIHEIDITPAYFQYGNYGWPIELDGMLPLDNTESALEIDSFHATLTQTQDQSTRNHLVDISFKAGSFDRKITHDGNVCFYEIIGAETSRKRQISDTTPLRLLTAILASQQFDENDPHSQSLTLDPDVTPELQQREPSEHMAALYEQLIFTLGHHSGESEVETRSIFNTKDGFIEATLSKSETSTRTDRKSRLSLTKVDTKKTLSLFNNIQQIRPIMRNHPSFLKKEAIDDIIHATIYAERISLDGIIEIIERNGNYNAWSKVCREFWTVISPDMTRLGHFDRQ